MTIDYIVNNPKTNTFLYEMVTEALCEKLGNKNDDGSCSFDGSFIGIGLLNESKLLDKTVKVTADAITPYVRKTKTLYVTIGYRFGMPAKAPTYSPPSGKPNYNNPCQLFKSC